MAASCSELLIAGRLQREKRCNNGESQRAAEYGTLWEAETSPGQRVAPRSLSQRRI